MPLLHPRHWPTWGGVGVLRLLALLPWPLLMAMGAGIGYLMIYPFAIRRRQIAEVNLQICYPEMDTQERKRLLRQHFVALGRGLMEVGMGWWWPQERLERLLLSAEGEEHLPASDDPRGTIVLTAHFSSLELSGRYLSPRLPFHPMYRTNENPVLEFLIKRYRNHYLRGVIPRDDVRAMIRILKKGEATWIAPDQNYAHKGMTFARFMGAPAATHTSTARFARATQARVIPFVVLRGGKGYHLRFEAPIEDFPSGDDTLDAERINLVFEQWIQLAPEQYNWIHRRFKTRPDGGPPPYPARRPKHR